MKLTIKQKRFADEYIISGNATEVYGYVYLITNLFNGKKYVGITTRTIKDRFSEHCKADSAIGKAIRKYGEDLFLINVIDEAVDKDELFHLEMEYISKYDSFNNGYNQTLGGEGVSLVKDLEIALTKEQARFVEKVIKRNKYEWDINNSREIIILSLRTQLMLYLTAKKARDKILIAKTIIKYPFVLESLVDAKLVSKEEIIHYSNQKLSSFEVYHGNN